MHSFDVEKGAFALLYQAANVSVNRRARVHNADTTTNKHIIINCNLGLRNIHSTALDSQAIFIDLRILTRDEESVLTELGPAALRSGISYELWLNTAEDCIDIKFFDRALRRSARRFRGQITAIPVLTGGMHKYKIMRFGLSNDHFWGAP